MNVSISRILFVVGMACLSVILPAQGQRNEIRMGLGMFVDSSLDDYFNEYIDKNNIWNDADEAGADMLMGLSLNAEYLYNLSNNIALGAGCGFTLNGKSGNDAEIWSRRFPDGGADNQQGASSSNTSSVRLNVKSLYFMPVMKTTWLRFKRISIYAKVALGVQYHIIEGTPEPKPDAHGNQHLPAIDDNVCRVAYQLSPIGVDYCWRRFHVFYELGYGRQAVQQLGVAYRF